MHDTKVISIGCRFTHAMKLRQLMQQLLRFDRNENGIYHTTCGHNMLILHLAIFNSSIHQFVT